MRVVRIAHNDVGIRHPTLAPRPADGLGRTLRSEAKPTRRRVPNEPPECGARHHFAAGTIVLGERGAASDAVAAVVVVAAATAAEPPRLSSKRIRDSCRRGGGARWRWGHVVYSEHRGRLPDGFFFQTNVRFRSSG